MRAAVPAEAGHWLFLLKGSTLPCSTRSTCGTILSSDPYTYNCSLSRHNVKQLQHKEAMHMHVPVAYNMLWVHA